MTRRAAVSPVASETTCSSTGVFVIASASFGAGRYLVDAGVREPDEVVRVELDLQAAAPGVDENRLVLERRGIDVRRQRPPLAEGARPAEHIARRAVCKSA